MSPSAEQPYTADLHEYIRVIRSRKWEIILVTAVVVVATLAFTFRQTPIYQGEAKVLVNALTTPNSSGAGIPVQPNMLTEQQLASSQNTAQMVQRALHISTPTNEMLDNLSVSVVSTTNVLQFDYSSPSPVTAAVMANAFAQAYITFRAQSASAQYRSAVAPVNAQIKTTQAKLAAISSKLSHTTSNAARAALGAKRDSYIAQMGVLQQRLSAISSAEPSRNTVAQVIQTARVPTSPASPNKVKNGGLALIVGLVLGVGLAFLRERLDQRIKSREALERLVGAPVLAAVPKVPGWKKREAAFLVTLREPKNPVSEAYRTLATNVLYTASQEPLGVLMITSPVAGEGKTATAANLAVALAQAGKRVILVSADIRKPRAHAFFGLAGKPGLTELLAGEAELADVAQPSGVENLRVIAGGVTPSNPAALLGSASTMERMKQLRDLADFVVVDTPPVLAVADASILAPLSDGALFITDASRSGRSAISQALEQLNTAGARIVGVVYNDFDPNATGAYEYYSYKYYYQYYGPAGDGVATNGAATNGGAKGRTADTGRHRPG